MHKPVCRFWAKVMHSCPSSLCQFSVHDFPEAFYNCCFNEVGNFREKSEHRVVVAHAFNPTGGSLSWRPPGQPEKHCLGQTKNLRKELLSKSWGRGSICTRTLTIVSSSEFHHPRSPLPLWSLFGTAGSARCLVYSGTY